MPPNRKEENPYFEPLKKKIQALQNLKPDPKIWIDYDEEKMKYLKQIVNLIITDENTDRDQIERILGSLNDEPPQGWLEHWNGKEFKNSKNERRIHKISLNWLYSSLFYVEDERKKKLEEPSNVGDAKLNEINTEFLCDFFIVIVITLDKGQVREVRSWINSSSKVNKPKATQIKVDQKPKNIDFVFKTYEDKAKES